jgi:hypothetical protein
VSRTPHLAVAYPGTCCRRWCVPDICLHNVEGGTATGVADRVDARVDGQAHVDTAMLSDAIDALIVDTLRAKNPLHYEDAADDLTAALVPFVAAHTSAAVAQAGQRVALLLCERHQDASPTRIPCAACSQDARDAIASETGA